MRELHFIVLYTRRASTLTLTLARTQQQQNDNICAIIIWIPWSLALLLSYWDVRVDWQRRQNGVRWCDNAGGKAQYGARLKAYVEYGICT